MLVADYRGLTVEQLRALREQLKAEKTGLHVLKNSMLRHAGAAEGMDGLERFLDGPSAIIAGDGEVTRVARALRKFIKENERPVLKGGLIERQAYGAADVDALADLPAREVMLGIFVGTVAAPMSRLAGVFRQKASSLLYVLKAAEEKKARA